MDEHDRPDDDPIMTEEEATKQKRNQLLTQLDKMEKANRETMDQLQRRGNTPNPLSLTRIRTELLITMVLGNQDSLARLQFELVWQQELRELLASMYQKANEKKLHVPGQG